MNEVIYYYDPEAELNVTSQEGAHFKWYLANKLKISQTTYNLLSEAEKNDITGNYIADYIPR